jgi:multidrug efflux pump subunit AcrB
MALLTSLALALTWTPTLSHYLIRRHGAGHRGVPGWLLRSYERVLHHTIVHPFLFGLFSLVVIAGSYLCYRGLGSDLLPGLDEGGFIIDYIMPAGSSLDETNRVVSAVEQILRAMPEVESTSRRTG